MTLIVQVLDERYSPVERVFKDTPSKLLEERLNDVMVAMVKVVGEVLANRVRRRENERRAHAEWLRRQDLERERAWRIAQGQALEALAERWERAERLRRFIRSVEANEKAPTSPGAPQELEGWLTWVRTWADGLDPLLHDDDGQGP